MDRLCFARRAMTLAGVLAAFVFIGDAAARDTRSLPPAKRTAVPAVVPTGMPTFFSIAQVLSRANGLVEPQAPQVPRDFGLRLASIAPFENEPYSEAPRRDPFSDRGYVQFGTTNPTVTAKWDVARKDLATDLAAMERCGARSADCSAAARTLRGIVDDARALLPEERVGFVNRSVNRAIRYASDVSRHGLVDVWSSPLKVIGGFGDCEDYAIAKYALLRRLGTASNDIRILLVWDQKAREDHAVLAVRQHGSWLMLDNRYDEVVEDTKATHYRPIFALQEAAVSLFAAPLTNTIDQDAVAPASGWAEEQVLEP